MIECTSVSGLEVPVVHSKVISVFYLVPTLKLIKNVLHSNWLPYDLI